MRRGDEACLAACEPRVAGFQRLTAFVLEQGLHGSGHLDTVSGQNGQGLAPGAGVGHGRARGDILGLIARHIRDQQGEYPRGMAGGGQPPALERGQMPTHAIHFGDACAAAQQGGIDRLLVRQRQARTRGHQQRGPTARNERDDQIIRPQSLNALQDALRGLQARGIGHRMGRFDNFDAATGHLVAIAGDHQPAEWPRPVGL